MKVNDSNTPNLSNLNATGLSKAAETEAASRAKEKHGVAGAGGSDADRVSLSNLSETLRAAMGDSPDRAAKLEKLSAEVASGRYRVDSATLAKDIVSDATKTGQ